MKKQPLTTKTEHLVSSTRLMSLPPTDYTYKPTPALGFRRRERGYYIISAKRRKRSLALGTANEKRKRKVCKRVVCACRCAPIRKPPHPVACPSTGSLYTYEKETRLDEAVCMNRKIKITSVVTCHDLLAVVEDFVMRNRDCLLVVLASY